MKLPLSNTEESMAHMNLILNDQTMETNITIHWTGGGQINECRHSSLAKFLRANSDCECESQRILNGVF